MRSNCVLLRLTERILNASLKANERAHIFILPQNIEEAYLVMRKPSLQSYHSALKFSTIHQSQRSITNARKSSCQTEIEDLCPDGSKISSPFFEGRQPTFKRAACRQVQIRARRIRRRLHICDQPKVCLLLK